MTPACPCCGCAAQVRVDPGGGCYCGRCFNIFAQAAAPRVNACKCPHCTNPTHKLEQARANYEAAKSTGQVVDVPIPAQAVRGVLPE